MKRNIIGQIDLKKIIHITQAKLLYNLLQLKWNMPTHKLEEWLAATSHKHRCYEYMLIYSPFLLLSLTSPGCIPSSFSASSSTSANTPVSVPSAPLSLACSLSLFPLSSFSYVGLTVSPASVTRSLRQSLSISASSWLWIPIPVEPQLPRPSVRTYILGGGSYMDNLYIFMEE